MARAASCASRSGPCSGRCAAEPLQRVELAFDAAVAGAQHAERIVEGGGAGFAEEVSHGRRSWGGECRAEALRRRACRGRNARRRREAALRYHVRLPLVPCRRMQALRTIRAEHRSLAAVIHGLVYLVREARTRAQEPDFALLATMLGYIEAFPERFHHPKEDAWLFDRLRQRHAPAAPLLDRLQAQHAEGAQPDRRAPGRARAMARRAGRPGARVGRAGGLRRRGWMPMPRSIGSTCDRRSSR